MSTSYEFLLVKKVGRIAIVSLNRPEVLNAVNMELHKELEDIWLDLGEDADVDVIVLTGEGRAFMAGGDLKRIADRYGTDEGRLHAFAVGAKAKRLLNNMLDFQKPIIAAVNGDAIGLGATIALFCDIVVMSESARIGDPHVRIGLSAGDGGAIIWPLLIGPARAKEYLMRGLNMTGTDAERAGLVGHAVPVDQVMTTALAIAQELEKLPAWAIRFTKSTINIALRQQLNQAMDASIASEALTMLSADHGEAIHSFLAKRAPSFKGS